MTGYRTPFAPTRRHIEADRGQRQRVLGESVALANLGIIAVNQTVMSMVTHAWSSSYTTGGEDITIPSFTGTVTVWAPAQLGYSFAYDSGTGKLLAYDPTGAEVAGTTDLEGALGTTPVYVTASYPVSRTVFVPSRDCVVTRVRFQVAEAVAQSGSSYWTIGVETAKGSETAIAQTSISGTAYSLSARTWVTVYGGLTGLKLSEGDALRLSFTETGTPSPLVDALVEVSYRREGAV